MEMSLIKVCVICKIDWKITHLEMPVLSENMVERSELLFMRFSFSSTDHLKHHKTLNQYQVCIKQFLCIDNYNRTFFSSKVKREQIRLLKAS